MASIRTRPPKNFIFQLLTMVVVSQQPTRIVLQSFASRKSPKVIAFLCLLYEFNFIHTYEYNLKKDHTNKSIKYFHYNKNKC